MASGEPPIIVKPGVNDQLMGVCVELNDSDGEWLIDQHTHSDRTIITIPKTAKWHVDRKEGDQNSVVIYIAGKKVDSAELVNFETGGGKHQPAQNSECKIHFSDISATIV